jgi:TRAP-type C4-dicarboxylate transport system substrate-binding protein
MKKFLFILVMIVLVSAFILGACAKPTGPIKLKAVSFLPPFIEDVHFLGVFAERVTAESVRTGVVHVGAPGAGLYADMVPEVLSMPLSRLSAQQERETGYYDFIADAHKKANLTYLGRLALNTNFYLFTNKKVAKPQELAGQKMASPFLFQDFMNSLGIVPVDIEDEYTGMQRGMIDGTGGADVQAAGSS